MTGKSIATTPERDLIDGVRVDTRATETTIELWDAPTQRRMPKKTTLMHEVMLTDGRVFYQCAMRPEECHAYAPSATSVNAHMKVHGARAELKRAQAALAELEAKRAQTRANRANGAKKAAVTRAERKAEAPTRYKAPDARAELRENLAKLRAELFELANVVDERLTEMRVRVDKAIDMLDALPEVAEDDPDLRALANLVKQIAQK